MREMILGDQQGGLRQQERLQPSTIQRTGAGLSLDQGAVLKQKDEAHQLMLLKRALKKKRSANYMNTVRLLDAGGQSLDQASFDLLVNEITQNLGPLDLSLARPVGLIDKCYLGDPYEVHMLDTGLNIIEHFEKGRPLPGVLEKYRGMAASGAYEFIEVYANCACAVRSNGNVTLIDA